ncbi:hypothetical protein [uncultured Novosphingobium sp.]|uniref:hypothetical protein n=1 Tax=uncultured Novosphingobium sp. TaxID=292277 RepID=UPI002596CAE3|nr:hypothetical protein [uncultured Novosphingobium sp.]
MRDTVRPIAAATIIAGCAAIFAIILNWIAVLKIGITIKAVKYVDQPLNQRLNLGAAHRPGSVMDAHGYGLPAIR